ncbi:dehydrogenase/reductase SDR family member 13-like [Tachypleus tridentatus]|uniref:dehydrogenase/reductase SDR family member 13-like n=1 Tax=Tachypleus tridentatus TaxID=6853 RepID=UPI003FD550FD
MLEGTLSVYAFGLIFPLALAGGLLFLIRYYIKKTEWCDSEERLDGKTILLTGGSSGLGRALSVELAKRGARVVVACRTKARRDSTAFFLRSKTGSFNVRVLFMDLTSLDSVWEFAREFNESEERLDAIINNAAILCDCEKTADGFDTMLGVNYLGHFLLTLLLHDKMRQCPDSPTRVLNVVCGGFRGGNLQDLKNLEERSEGAYSIKQYYRNSKLAQFLFTKEVSRRYREMGIVSFAVDPGLVSTNLYAHLTGFSGQLSQAFAKVLYRTPEEGVQTILYCLLTKGIEPESGKLFRDCKVQDVHVPEWDDQAAKTLWENTSKAIEQKGIKLNFEEAEEE